jgi:hypothetical protein
VLELDRTARGHHSGGEQRGRVGGTGAQRSDSDHGRAGADHGRAGADHGRAGPGRAPGGQRTAGRARSRAADPEQVGEDSERPERGDDRGEAPAHSAQVVAELPAAGAVAHVAARHRVRSQAAVVREDQLLADV